MRERISLALIVGGGVGSLAAAAADQLAVFVALEIAESDYYVVRIKRGRYF